MYMSVAYVSEYVDLLNDSEVMDLETCSFGASMFFVHNQLSTLFFYVQLLNEIAFAIAF